MVIQGFTAALTGHSYNLLLEIHVYVKTLSHIILITTQPQPSLRVTCKYLMTRLNAILSELHNFDEN